jgi:hypothetical protein
MALAVVLKGAAIGAVMGFCLEGISAKITGEYAKIGAIHGIALAIVGHYAGQTAFICGLIGSVTGHVFAAWASKPALISNKDDGNTRYIFVVCMFTLFGAAGGYGIESFGTAIKA